MKKEISKLERFTAIGCGVVAGVSILAGIEFIRLAEAIPAILLIVFGVALIAYAWIVTE